MTINILVFGAAKDIVGVPVVVMQLEQAAPVAEIKQWLTEQYPALAALSSFALAVNGAYAQPSALVRAGDEVAIIPPVSGG